MASKGQTVSSWARYLKASCQLYHVAAMVRVEDVDDIPFWQSEVSGSSSFPIHRRGLTLM